MAQPTLWAGIDAGKAAHHCVAINADGQRVLSRRVVNDEDALRDPDPSGQSGADGGAVRWAIDLEFRRCGAVDHAVARRRPGNPLHPWTGCASRLWRLPR